MYDSRSVNTKFSEPTILVGRFVGNGTSQASAFANTSKGLTINRTGVGAHTITCSDLPIGIIQTYDVEVASGTNLKSVLITPPAAGATTLAVAVVWAANGVAVDLTTSEELLVELWTARTQVP